MQFFDHPGATGKCLKDTIPLVKDPKISRISYFSDKEGKSRVIAIIDYWSQTALKPYHNFYMKLLKGLSRDCTFNHDSYRFLKSLPGPFHSLDLSNATDRMPMWLQVAIFAHIFGEEKSRAWDRMLTSREFHSKAGLLRYGAGQPMGAYSSWASMAFTHHFIVQYAAYKAGFRKEFRSYVVLGDDVVIASDIVASAYRTLLQNFDMPFSKAKTHVSKDSWEFAKRWYIRKTEVSGFSMAGLMNV